MGEPAVPPPMAELTVPLATVASVIAAGQLGVFRALAEGSCAPVELAQRLGVQEAGIARLVELLGCVGYLQREADGRYANSSIPRAWLSPTSPVDFTPALLWAAEVWRLLEYLEASVRHGGPRQTMYEFMSEHPAAGRIFGQYMKATAQLAATVVAETAYAGHVGH